MISRRVFLIGGLFTIIAACNRKGIYSGGYGNSYRPRAGEDNTDTALFRI